MISHTNIYLYGRNTSIDNMSHNYLKRFITLMTFKVTCHYLHMFDSSKSLLLYSHNEVVNCLKILFQIFEIQYSTSIKRVKAEDNYIVWQKKIKTKSDASVLLLTFTNVQSFFWGDELCCCSAKIYRKCISF